MDNKKIKKSWLNNKTFLLSGASSGIGRELARTFVNVYGAKVIGLARREERLKALQTELGDSFSYYVCDVTKLENWESLKNQLEKDNRHFDILLNNAGIIHPFKRFIDIDQKTINNVFSTNLYSTIYSLKTFLPTIIQNHGSIINVCSAGAFVGIPGMSIYCATKSALSALTSSLSAEVPKGIYVAGIYPGFTKTELFKKKDGEDILKKKDEKIISKFFSSLEGATKKIARRIHKKRKRICVGVDTGALRFFTKLFPSKMPSMINWAFRVSKLETFEDLFKD